MLMFEWILVLLLAAVILTNLAERQAVPYPSLLAIAGARYSADCARDVAASESFRVGASGSWHVQASQPAEARCFCAVSQEKAFLTGRGYEPVQLVGASAMATGK